MVAAEVEAVVEEEEEGAMVAAGAWMDADVG